MIRAETSAGTLIGSDEDGILAFKGIPFAAAPVGPLRFRPPQPVARWSGSRSATSFAPACPQATTPGGRESVLAGLFGPGDLPSGEDCLYLNVWAPALDGAPRPVLVWIHGGGFRTGTGASPMYDGTALARRGNSVVVTINYRLGVLGFLHDPRLGVANAGLLDQVAALEWVRREIAAFGGDPDNVTCFGESAGAKSVEILLTMPAARGLFRRAILESTYDLAMDPVAAGERTQRYLVELGCPDAELSTLQALPLSDLLGAQQRLLDQQAARGAAAIDGFAPAVDGEVVPRDPVAALGAGVARDVPVIVGTNVDELRLGAALQPNATIDEATLIERVRVLLGGSEGSEGAARATDAVGIYRRSLARRGAPAGGNDVLFALMTNRTFRAHSIRVAEAQGRHQRQTFMYLFGWTSPALDGLLGSFHTLEIPFVFGTFDTRLGELAGPGAGARALSAAMQDAWLAFAASGDPGCDPLPAWPPYAAPDRNTMVLDRACRIESTPLEDERRVWAALEDVAPIPSVGG